MCNWKKWIWPGIFTVVMLTALAIMMKSGSIEQDLRSKALNDLSDNYKWAQVALDGRDLTLTGVAPSDDAVTEALQLADDAYDVRVANALTTLLPIASPFKLTAIKAENSLTLDGNVPNDKARAALIAAAKLASSSATSGAKIIDNLSLARGAPDGFSALADFGISQLSGLKTGSAIIDGSNLSMSGEAKDVAAYDVVIAMLLGKIPGDGTLLENAITSPAISPYPFSATKDDTGIVLSGYVPDETTRTSLIEAAKATTSGPITDKLEIGEGEPTGFSAIAGFGISQLTNLSVGTSKLTDSKLSLKGTALNPQAYDKVTNALVGEIPSGGKLSVSDITRSTVSPFTFSATKDDGILVLDGYVSSNEEKTNAISFASTTNPSERIIDRLVIVNGAPDGINWGEATQLAIKQASMLVNGSASLNDTAYSIAGTAKTNAAYDLLSGDDELPSGLSLLDKAITRPIISPYVWTFTNIDGDTPSLTGYVPDNELTMANIEQIKTKLGTANEVANSLEIGAGAPVNLAAVTSVGIQAASRLYNGKAQIIGSILMVTGEAYSDGAASDIRARIENALPPGYVGKHDITVRNIESVPVFDVAQCQSALFDQLKGNVIRFESAKAIVKQDSFGLLDRLAFVTKRCSTATVEIEGHTDSDGSDAANQTLSEARANSVRSYLVETGIFVGRMKAIGYGENNPVADNSTPEGKALNRRIEFKVIR